MYTPVVLKHGVMTAQPPPVNFSALPVKQLKFVDLSAFFLYRELKPETVVFKYMCQWPTS